MNELRPPAVDAIVLKGGLDQITPTLSLAGGAVRQAVNFECSVTGGYTRILGYERVDGHPSPTDTAALGAHRYISVASYVGVAQVGSTLTASGGATGVIAYIAGLVMVVAKSSGTWAVGETVSIGATLIGTVNNINAGPADPKQDAKARKAVADIYRADIYAPPGSGPTRGVVEFNDVVYSFRDNAAGTALDIYKSSASGWVQVPLYKTISFTGGGIAFPVDGNTLTQGAVTATVKRVVRCSGAWDAGSAAGQLIITTPTGGNFAAGAATVGTVNITLAGAQSQLALLPGGKFEFNERNFAGNASTIRLYGCDGVNKGFEFDGDVLVPITTGAASDAPTHSAVHKEYLFFSLGSSVMYSAPGLPYDWTAISGAGEIATGDVVTEIISMPGDANSSSLGICNRGNTHVLYQRALYDGGFSNWTLVSYNTGTGAVPFSGQNMAQTFVFDDRGVNSIQTAVQYGNFSQSTLTNQILPFITERSNLFSYSTLCRKKSQYRIFFSDGYGLFITMVNNKLLGCMPVYFPDPVTCAYEGKNSSGVDVIYFGSSNGMIYQMEKGTSFDGDPIDWNLVTNYANAKTPRTLKRYRKASPELSASNNSYIEFDFSYLLGYDSDEYSQPDTSSYNRLLGQARWDSFTWDNFFWDSKSQGPLESSLDGTAENIAFLFTGSADYIPAFTINSILYHYSPRRMMR